MSVSTFELFKPGIGPSSSHTMGPMTAAQRFIALLRDRHDIDQLGRIRVTLYASLALTGRGHATDRAVILGLAGFDPATLDPDVGDATIAAIRQDGVMLVGGDTSVGFVEERDIVWAGRERLSAHPNALTFTAIDAANQTMIERSYFSIGGGFVLDEEEIRSNTIERLETPLPHRFDSAQEMLDLTESTGLSIADIMLANEESLLPRAEVYARLDAIHAAMDNCIDRGLRQDGILPGGLSVPRRAKALRENMLRDADRQSTDPLGAVTWINLWALAVNEENAAGGRVVTAPTNGAAGIIPAVLRFYCRFYHGTPEGVRIFLLTAAAVGGLYKRNASISGAEVGCQGEVGVACSMAAAGLAAARGGTPAQIENAAEIAMEHNLGLTCDPIGGLVQIPCIERNALGAMKAVDAVQLAMMGDGRHAVSLDKVIATMLRTGRDMNMIYKETSLGGLAVNLADC